ncbi:MAG: hypothetical protein DMG19_20260, partial [Acidobacteria bacterium]
STDAVIRNVQVTLINKQTNISRETFTNDVGFYRFVAIDPGNYSMEFRTPGFETHKIDDFAVKTAQEVVINQTLAPASVAAEISVFETPGSELAKTTATVERTFTEREINELPMQVYNNDGHSPSARLTNSRCRCITTSGILRVWLSTHPWSLVPRVSPNSPRTGSAPVTTTSCWMASIITTSLSPIARCESFLRRFSRSNCRRSLTLPNSADRAALSFRR